MRAGEPVAWRWVERDVVYTIHERQLAEHGGADGARDPGVIESALARAQNLATYATPDVAALAGAYAFGLAKNHGFVDGNKRTAWVTSRLFLIDNGQRLEFDPIDAVRIMEGVAAGLVSETDLADWFRRRIVT